MKVAILGAGGLTGKQLLELLTIHPHFEVVHITSDKFAGKSLESIFPGIGKRYGGLSFKTHNAEIPSGALVVLAVPDEVSLSLAPKLLDSGYSVIDLSGVFRLHSKSEFESYYSRVHGSFHLMDRVVYGLPEMNRAQIRGAKFVSNPGCYATSAILPIFMLGELRKKLSNSICISAASGVSGAGGRKEEIAYSFTSVYENYKAYRVLNHQHTPEIVEYSGFGLKEPLPELIFTPHLLPIHTGILTDIVLHFSEDIRLEEIKSEYDKFKSEPFIRFLKEPEDVNLHRIQKTNFLDLGFRLKGRTLVILSALDNLVKGAAGQALQNMNLMAGFPEDSGLL